MKMEKSAGGMLKQIFQIQKYGLVNLKLERNIKPRWEINTIENTGVFLFPFNFEDFLRTPPVAASLKFRILNIEFSWISSLDYCFPQKKLEN